MTSVTTTESSPELDLLSAGRILFRTGRGLGDAVLCEPLVRAIAAQCPQAELHVELPGSCNGIGRLGFSGDYFHVWRESDKFYEDLAGYDVVIDADPAEYIGPFETETHDGGTVIRLFAHYRPEATRTTAYERMAEGLQRCGIDALDDVPSLSVPDGDSLRGQYLLGKIGARPGHPVIAFHPGSNAQFAYKRWRPEGFAFVANEFALRYGSNILLIGSGDEREQIERIIEIMPLGTQAIPTLDFPLYDLACILSACDLVIGNDSGVGHLAAALGRPVVTIAGPTYAHFWGPLTNRAIVTDPEGCCYNPGACGVRCLNAIRACEVVGVAEALLTATTGRETYECLDPICLAPDLVVKDYDADGLVLRSRSFNLPLTVSRGRVEVRRFLSLVQRSRSTRSVRAGHADADMLLEQCVRHGIVLPDQRLKASAPRPHKLVADRAEPSMLSLG